MKKTIRIGFIAMLLTMFSIVSMICVFAADGVTVSFYDNGSVVASVTVDETEVPTPPEVEEIIVVDGVGYRFLGWTKTEGGTTVEDLTYHNEDVSYYAVREAVSYKVEKTDGSVLWYALEVPLSTVAENSENGDIITACSDADIDGTSAVYWDKSITLDLNGNTLTTTSYIIPDGEVHIVICNGTVNITSKELVQMSEYRSSSAKLELRDIVAIKESGAANKYLLDVRVGSIVMDNVTVNSEEWNIPSSGANAFITTGYRTKEVAEPINFDIKNSNISLPKINFISATGASGETNGYSLSVNINDSYIKSAAYILNLFPADTAIDNCWLDMKIAGLSTVITTSGFTNQIMFNIDADMKDDQVVIWADYGVEFSKLPKIAAGTVLLGDGDAMLEMVTSNGYGVVTDLWVDDYEPVTDYEYSFCIVGDTQMTTDYDPDNLYHIYDWIVNNKDAKKMQYVFGMGDITNHSADDEWEISYNQISKLDGIVDYSLLRGNHDMSDGFNSAFNNDTYKSMFDGFYSEDLIENSYVAFTVGETKYLHITLDYHPSDAILSWAGGIIEQYYDHRVIISTHDFLESSGDLNTAGGSNYGTTNSGEYIWNKLVSQYENVFLVLSGHVFSTELVSRQLEGVHGNTVTALMTNGQTLDYRNGAMGLVSMLYFSADGTTVSVEYYSTVYDRYLGTSSQFVLTVPEYTVSEPQEKDYLYSVTAADGTTEYYDSAYNFSDILTTYASNGSLVKLYGDVSVDTGIKITKYISINLNGYTISSDGGKIQGRNSTVNIINGGVKITKNNFIYIDVGYSSSIFNISDIEVYHTTDYPTVALADIRTGVVNLDAITVAEGSWNGASAAFVTAGYRTNSVSGAITVNLRNSSVNLGESDAVFMKCIAASTETNGWTVNLSVTSSEITTTGYIMSANPTAESAENCIVNVSFDGNTALYSDNLFNISESVTRDKISVSFDIGARTSSTPVVDGVDIYYSGGFIVYDSECAMYVVMTEADFGCKLVDSEGKVYQYYAGNAFTKELVDMAEAAGCTIVFLNNMEMPNGTSTASADQYNIYTSELCVDLNGYKLTIPSYARFRTDATTSLTIRNGVIEHAYTVFYSYSGNDEVTSFTAENVKFIATTTYATFDHRIGIITLNECEFEFSLASSSSCAIFVLGNVANATNEVKVYMNDCTINATGSARSIFKLYGGRPVTIIADGCSFTMGSSAYLVQAISSHTTSSVDSITVNDCEINKNSESESIFSISYDDITLTLSEIYVSGGSPYNTDKGTVSLAKGQTQATVKEGGYMITAPKIKVEVNLTLYTDFTLNIWIPTDSTGISIAVGEEEYLLSESEVIMGKYWIPIQNISVNTAADSMDILITYVDNEKTLTVVKTYSVLKYASRIIKSGNYSDEVESLLVYTLNYINSVYSYVGKEIPADLTEFMESEWYLNALANETSNAVSSTPKSTADIGTASNVIYSARLMLDTSVHFVFVLAQDYSGYLVLEYAGEKYEYTVEEGLVNGCDYVLVDMRAHALYNGVICVTAGEYSGEYDLAAYMDATKEYYPNDDALSTLLLDLYNYCREANEYRTYVRECEGLN